GKLKVIQFARENKIPYLGLCYGMQLMVVEFARNVLKLKDAHTTEIKPKTKNPVIDIMEHQKKHMEEGRYGASMRLGAWPCKLKKGTMAAEAYSVGLGKSKSKNKTKSAASPRSISERHRHRFEVNNNYIEQL